MVGGQGADGFTGAVGGRGADGSTDALVLIGCWSLNVQRGGGSDANTCIAATVKTVIIWIEQKPSILLAC